MRHLAPATSPSRRVPPTRLFLIASLAAAALMPAPPVCAEDGTPRAMNGAAEAPAPKEDLTAQVDAIFASIPADAPGCAVAVSLDGEVLVRRAYGLADVERKVPLTPDAAFDIGSTQKQFVAAAILLLAQDQRLALTDDVRKHLKEFPDYGHIVTIDHLLTHTGGVRDWLGLLPLAEEGTDVLQLILRQRGLNFPPGEEWSYSNSGYVLLKEIVARASGKPFAEFARERLFEPLGMKSSAYVSDILQYEGERAIGYQKDGKGWKPFMRLGNQRGGGAIVSTVGDLVAWNDALTQKRLGAFVSEKLEEQARLRNGRVLDYARGLIVNVRPGARVVSHSGGAAGYSTWLGRFTDHGLSIAVTCNFDPVSAMDLARQVAWVFLPPEAKQEPPAGPAAVPGVDISRRAGIFFDARTGEPLRLFAEGGRLTIAGKLPLVPVAADRFRPQRPSLYFRSQDDFVLAFRSDDEIDLRSMEGETTRYLRAQRWTPAEEEVAAFAGRYSNEDVGLVLELMPGKNGLLFRSLGGPEKTVEAEPVARDVYMRSLVTARFVRDAGGKVVGFDYGNPAVRNLRFTKLGEPDPEGRR